jgi:predicted amidophosphoribosyltransferase
MRLLEDDNTFIQFQSVEPLNLKTKKGMVCSSCKKECDKLYQQDMCRNCLTQTFKRLVKVIDSVRK